MTLTARNADREAVFHLSQSEYDDLVDTSYGEARVQDWQAQKMLALSEWWLKQ